MLLLSDVSRQEGNQYTTSQQEFDVSGVSEQATEDSFPQTKKTHDGDRSPNVSDTISHCFRVRGDFQSTSLALRRVRGRTKQRIRTAQSARILELQIEIDTLELLAELNKRARCEVIREQHQRMTYEWMRKDAALFLMG